MKEQIGYVVYINEDGELSYEDLYTVEDILTIRNNEAEHIGKYVIITGTDLRIEDRS